MAKLSFSTRNWLVFIITPGIAKGMNVSIERRCIKVAIIFNDRGICVEHSFEFSVSKPNTVTLKEW